MPFRAAELLRQQAAAQRLGAQARRPRLCRLEPVRLWPLQEWLVKYERAWDDRLDRVVTTYKSYSSKESGSDTSSSS